MEAKRQTVPAAERPSRRRPPVRRTLLPGDRAELLADALDDLSELRDAREDADAAEAMERECAALARRCVELEAAVRAVACAQLDTLPAAVALCRRAVRW